MSLETATPIESWNEPLRRWRAVWDQLKAHRPQFAERCDPELDCALAEIRRLQALDKSGRAGESWLMDAWASIYNQLYAHNPKFWREPGTAASQVIAEIRRLQALDRPAQTSTDDLRDAALELLAAFSITSQDARERAIRRMCEVLKAARREGQL